MQVVRAVAEEQQPQQQQQPAELPPSPVAEALADEVGTAATVRAVQQQQQAEQVRQQHNRGEGGGGWVLAKGGCWALVFGVAVSNMRCQRLGLVQVAGSRGAASTCIEHHDDWLELHH